MPANKLVQVCGELNLENFWGLKLIAEEKVCGWAWWAHVCVIGTCLLKLPPSSEILCPLTLGQAFQVHFSPFFPAPFPLMCVSSSLSPLVYNVPVTKELRVTYRAQSVGPAWQLTLSCTGKVERTLADITVSCSRLAITLCAFEYCDQIHMTLFFVHCEEKHGCVIQVWRRSHAKFIGMVPSRLDYFWLCF